MSAVDAILEDQEYLDEEYVKLSPIAQAVVNWQMKWNKDAHDHQIEPMGDWWNIWLMLAGRGAGIGDRDQPGHPRHDQGTPPPWPRGPRAA